jgi:very-short-patch-repair endonuclease
MWVAVLHAGRGAALSGDAVLHAIGFPIEPPQHVDVLVPHGRNVTGSALPGGGRVRPRQSRALEALRDHSAAVPSVSRHVACLQAAAWAPSDRSAEWRVAAMVQRRLSAVPLLQASLALLPRLPRRALLREVLQDVELGAHAASEMAFLRFLRRNNLPLPDELQVKTRLGQQTAYLDARYREQRVSFEVDGAHHRDAGTWDADLLRTLRIAVSLPGERVLRLSTSNLRHDEREVAGLMRQLLVVPDGNRPARAA